MSKLIRLVLIGTIVFAKPSTKSNHQEKSISQSTKELNDNLEYLEDSHLPIELRDDVRDIERVLKKSKLHGMRMNKLSTTLAPTTNPPNPYTREVKETMYNDVPKDGFILKTFEGVIGVGTSLVMMLACPKCTYPIHNDYKYNYILACSGILITRRHILTSAQCCHGIGLGHGTEGYYFAHDFARLQKKMGYEAYQMYYDEHFMENTQGPGNDICVVKSGDFTPALKDIDPKYNKPVFPQFPKMDTSRELADLYPDDSVNWKGCTIWGHQDAKIDNIILVPVQIITNVVCFETYKILVWGDQFCSIPKTNPEKPPDLKPGGAIICHQDITGILINSNRYKASNESQVYIATRIDFHDKKIYPHLGYRRTYGPTSERRTIPTQDFFKDHEKNDAWDLLLRLLKLIALFLALILILGLCIRIILGGIRICVRHSLISMNRNPDHYKFTRKGYWIPQIHPRMVPAFFTMVLSILMYVFERHDRLPAIKRIRKLTKASP